MCIAVKAKVLDADQLEFKSQLHFLLLVGEFCFLSGEDSVFLTLQSGQDSDLRQGRAHTALGRREPLLRVGMAEAGVILFYLSFLLAAPCSLWDLSSPIRD